MGALFIYAPLSLAKRALLGLFFTIVYGLSSVWIAVMGFVIEMCGSFKPDYELMAILALMGILAPIYTKYR
jgi:hypothetical protein